MIILFLIFIKLSALNKEEFEENPYKFYNKNYKKIKVFNLEPISDNLMIKNGNYIDIYINYWKKKKIIFIPKQNRYHSYLGYHQERLFDILLSSDINNEINLTNDLKIFPFNQKIESVCNKKINKSILLKVYDEDDYEFIDIISFNQIIRFDKCSYFNCENKIIFNKKKSLNLTIEIIGNKTGNFYETIYIILRKKNNDIIEPYNINLKIIPNNNFIFDLFIPYFELSETDEQKKPYYVFYKRFSSSSTKIKNYDKKNDFLQIIGSKELTGEEYSKKMQNKLFEIKVKRNKFFKNNEIKYSDIKINLDLKNNNNLYIPYIIMNKRGENKNNEFFDENFINFGLITEHNNNHVYNLYGKNNFGLPAILINFTYESSEPDFRFDVATYYSNYIAFPFQNQKFWLMKLIAKPIKTKKKLKIKGTLNFSFNVLGEIRHIKIDFWVFQYFNIFDPDKKNYFKLNLNLYDQSSKNIFNFFQWENIFLKNIFPFKIMLKKIKLQNLKNNIQLDVKQQYFESIKISSKEEKIPFNLIFKGIYNELKNNFISRNYLLKFQIFKSNTGIYFNYFDFKWWWSLNNNEFSKYNEKQMPKIDFGYISINEERKITLKLKNKNENNIVIKNITLNNKYIKMNIYKYYNKKKVLMDSKINYIKLNSLLEKGEIIHIHFVLKCDIELKADDYGIIETNTGVLKFIVNFNIIKGKIELFPKELVFEEFYPSNIKNYKIKANSTFNFDANIEIFTKYVKEFDVLSLIKLQDKIYSNKNNQEIISWDFNPSIYGESFHLSYSQNICIENKICMKDIEIWLDSKSILEKIEKMENKTFNISLNINTNLQKKLKMNIKGKIKPPQFINTNILDFDILPRGNLIEKTILVKNPYKEPIKMLFFIHKLQHLGLENFESKISEVLTLMSKNNKLNEKICMSNKLIDSDSLKFFSKYLLLENIKFIESETTKNKICFLIPDNEIDKETLYNKFSLMNNFFFTFNQPNKIMKDEILNTKVIIMNDIIKYNQRKPKIKYKIFCKFCLLKKIKRKLKSIKYFLKKNIKKIKRYFYKKKKKPIFNWDDEKNLLYINFLSHKEQQKLFQTQKIFLNKNILEKTFVFKPFEEKNLTLFTIDTRNSKNQNNEVLFIKTNNTLNQMIPIFYKIGVVDLKIENKKIKNQLIYNNEFNFDIYKNLKIIEKNNLKFYKPIERNFVLINKGNITVTIEKMLIEKERCKNNDFSIINCSKFSLNPDERKLIKIRFHPKNQIFDGFQRKIYLFSKNEFFIFYFNINLYNTKMIKILYKNHNILEAISEQIFYWKLILLIVVVIIFFILRNTFKIKKIKNIKKIKFLKNYSKLNEKNSNIIKNSLNRFNEKFDKINESKSISIKKKKSKWKKKEKKLKEEIKITENSIRPRINSKNKDQNVSNLSLEKNLVNMIDQNYNKEENNKHNFEFSEISKNNKSNSDSIDENFKYSFERQKQLIKTTKNIIKKDLDKSENAGVIGDKFKIKRENSKTEEEEIGYSHFKLENIELKRLKNENEYYYKFDENWKFLGQNNPFNLFNDYKNNEKENFLINDPSFYFNNSIYRDNSKIFNLDNKDINLDYCSIVNSEDKCKSREKRIEKLKQKKINFNSLKKTDDMNYKFILKKKTN